MISGDQEARPTAGAHRVARESRRDGTRHRSALTWGVAAGAALIIGVGIAIAVHDRDDAGPDGTGDTTSPAESITRLTLDPARTGRCVPPTPLSVAGSDLAFDGVVTSISGGVVTLRPGHWYRGEATDVVTVRAADDTLDPLLDAVRFEEGARYLVAAEDGDLAACGVSQPWSKTGRKLYADAFGG